MFAALAAWRKRQYFEPSALGLLVNPVFIIRRGLYKGIVRHAPKLRGRILDFGAGSAPYKRLFLNATSYVTVDIEVSGHPEENKIADYFYDGHTLPFSSGDFDAVFSSEVFEHIFNLPEILAELNRILKADGTLLISTPFIWDEHEMPHDFARYTSEGMRHLLQEAGFVVDSVEKTTGYVETIFQMFSVYVMQRRVLRMRILRVIATLIFAAPINGIGIVLNMLLPKDDRLFHNLVVLCRNTKNDKQS